MAVPVVNHSIQHSLPVPEDSVQGTLQIAADQLLETLIHLRDQDGFDFLSSVTCTDYLSYQGKNRDKEAPRFDVVYHLFSTGKGGGHLTLHVPVPESGEVPSATAIFPGANLQEREVWDLYGIGFTGHPNLRRILLWEGFSGHPMRKDWQEGVFRRDSEAFQEQAPARGFHAGRRQGALGQEHTLSRKLGSRGLA